MSSKKTNVQKTAAEGVKELTKIWKARMKAAEGINTLIAFLDAVAYGEISPTEKQIAAAFAKADRAQVDGDYLIDDLSFELSFQDAFNYDKDAAYAAKEGSKSKTKKKQSKLEDESNFGCDCPMCI